MTKRSYCLVLLVVLISKHLQRENHFLSDVSGHNGRFIQHTSEVQFNIMSHQQIRGSKKHQKADRNEMVCEPSEVVMKGHVMLNGCDSLEAAKADQVHDLQTPQSFKGSRYETKGPPIYSRLIQEQEVRRTEVGVWWTEELSKYPVIWGKPGLGFFLAFALELCIQVWTWKDGGVGKDFIWLCKGVFWKAAFLKGLTVRRRVCSFKMRRNYEWKPF